MYISWSRGESLCKSTYRRVLPFPLCVSFLRTIVSLPLRRRPSRFLSQGVSTRPVPFSASEGVYARERCCYTAESTGTRSYCARVMKSSRRPCLTKVHYHQPRTLRCTPGAAASPYVHEILHYAFFKRMFDSRFPSSFCKADDKNEEIFSSFVAQDNKKTRDVYR